MKCWQIHVTTKRNQCRHLEDPPGLSSISRRRSNNVQAMMQARAAASFERGPPRLMDNSLLRPRSIFPFPIALHTQRTTLPLFNVFSHPEVGRNETFNNTSPLVQICRCLSICNCLCSHLWSAEFLLERYKENIWAMIFVFYIFFVSIFVIVFAFIFTGRMERRPIITCSASGRRSCAFASLAPFSRWPQINLISWPIFCICHWFCFFFQ